MTPAAQLVLTVVLATVGIAAAVVALAGARSRSAHLEDRLTLAAEDVEVTDRLRDSVEAVLLRFGVFVRLRQRLEAAAVSLPMVDVLLVAVSLGIVAFVVVDAVAPALVALLAVVLLGRVGLRRLDRRLDERRAAFVAQLPELARVLSNGAGAGRSLVRSMELAGEDLEEPAGSEIGRVVREIQIGATLDEALHDLEQRVPSREVGVLVTTLLVQQRAGGDLVSALREMSVTLDARAALREEVRTLMAGSVFTGYLTTVLGIGTVLLLNVLAPGVIDAMFASTIGRLAMLVAGGLFVVGNVLVRRATNVEV